MIWLLACASPPPETAWTVEAALAPALARLDRDGDGRVGEAEYEATQYKGKAFAVVDLDHDGTLDWEELHALTTSQDPKRYHDGVSTERRRGPPPGPRGGPARPPPGGPPPGGAPPGGAPPGGPPPKQDSLAWMTLGVLRLEVLDRDPLAAVPSAEDIVAASASGDIDAPEARAALAVLQRESERLGLGFPESLAQE